MRVRSNSIAPIVSTKDGKVFANSLDVAAYFGKAHRTVIAKIDTLLKDLPVPHAYFHAGVYKHKNTGDQIHTCFDMTRDGFTLVATGFTGAKALQFKLAYIAAFNDMEEKGKVNTLALPNFADPAEAAIAWAAECHKT